MATAQILALMALVPEIEAPLKTYNAALRKAWRTATDSDENDAAQERGNAALLDMEAAIRLWIAQHPEAQKPPSDNHAATYLDSDGDLWAEYLTSPRSGHVVPLQIAPVETVERADLEDRIGPLRPIGWHRQA